MLRLLAKAGFASGTTILGITFTTDSLVTIPSTRQDKTSEFKKTIKEINTLGDIEIYEKVHGCAFTYVASWRDKKVYRAKEFLKNEKTTYINWQEKLINGAKNYKSKCKNNEIVTLFFDSKNNKVFFPSSPPE